MAIVQELGLLWNDLWPYLKKSQPSLMHIINQCGSMQTWCLILENPKEIKKMQHVRPPHGPHVTAYFNGASWQKKSAGGFMIYGSKGQPL